MFFFPIGTDAPIYHFPWATIGMIVVNTLVWMSSLADGGEALADYMLPKGEGITPLECVTSNFVHGDFFHLLGNMFVVWTFGLIVEGKVGWWRFLLIYNGIGFFECAIEQAIQWNAVDEPASCGSSAIAYGLIAMSLIWAPRNDVNVFYFYWFFLLIGTGVKEVPIMVFAWLSFAFSLFVAWLTGFEMDSEMFHLLGAAVGVVVGVGMLKLKLVDCENWDLFSVVQKREGKKTKREVRRRTRRPAPENDNNGFIGDSREFSGNKPVPSPPSARAAAALRSALQSGGIDQAFDEYARVTRRDGPPQEESLSLINALLAKQRWDDAIVVMADYLREHHVKAVFVRLKLAETLIVKLQRPRQGLKVLDKLDGAVMSQVNESARDKLKARAEAILDDSPLELGLQDW